MNPILFSKLIFATLVVFYLSTGIVAVPKNIQCLKKEGAGIIPDFASRRTKSDLKVVWKGSVAMDCGNKIKLTDVLDAPVVTYDLTAECQNASITLFDRETPPPTHLHWFEANIPTTDVVSGATAGSGDAILSYQPPAGPTGGHRYILCIYCQTKPITASNKPEILPLGLGYKAKSYPLSERAGLGHPKACNFMRLVVSELQPTPFKADPTGVKTPVVGGLYST